MPLKVATVMQAIEKLAPKRLAETWDNVGLLLGNPADEVNGILVCLDVTRGVAAEALAKGANMIISHHPLIFKALKRLTTDTASGTLIYELINQRLNVYAAHTNLDITPGGVNDMLAETFALADVQVLAPRGREQLFKLVVFVPEGHQNEVANALSEAGAGWIGNYSHCTFQTSGKGTFMPLQGANPFIGKQGKLETVDEYRLETIVPQGIIKQVLRAMLKSHPYEEVAYDIYPLDNEGKTYGLGRVGRLPQPCTLDQLAGLAAGRLGGGNIRVAGDPGMMVTKVALCGGAGGDLISQAFFSGAQALITGDVTYHQAQEAVNLGLAVIDAGHGATELPLAPALARYLSRELSAQKYDIPVFASETNTDPWRRG